MRKFPSSSTQIRQCPFCGADHIDEGIFEDEGGGSLTRTDSCPRCDGTWRIEFAFTRWAVVLHPDTLEEAPPQAPGLVLAFSRNV